MNKYPYYEHDDSYIIINPEKIVNPSDLIAGKIYASTITHWIIMIIENDYESRVCKLELLSSYNKEESADPLKTSKYSTFHGMWLEVIHKRDKHKYFSIYKMWNEMMNA